MSPPILAAVVVSFVLAWRFGSWLQAIDAAAEEVTP